MTQPGEMTIADLAKGLDVSETTIKTYLARGCPRTSVRNAKKWRKENIRSPLDDIDDDALGLALKRAELRERDANARTRDFKLEMLKKRMIDRDEVERDLRTGISRLVNRLNSLPVQCANICPAELKAPIKEKIEDTVRLALRELCDDLQVTA